MEESLSAIRTTPTGYDKEADVYKTVKISEPLGVVVKIDNEDEFKGIFDKKDEVDVFKQILSQQVAKFYRDNIRFKKAQLVSYKEDGDIIFELVEIKQGSLYGGNVIVAHYNFASTVS